MRANVLERYYRTFMYLPVDRVPDVEFGYWPQTIRRWVREGLGLELTADEQKQMFLGKLDKHLRNETGHWGGIELRWGMHPVFEEKIVERRAKSVLMIDSSGALAERYQNDADDSSIPHYLEFPVKTPADWDRLKKERYRLDDPWREIPQDKVAQVYQDAAAGKMIHVGCPGPYGQLRGWMGMENLSYAFHEEPGMVHDMVERLTELTVQQIRRLPPDLPIDSVSFWEDMAGKAGPLVGPQMFREFLQPCYHAIMTELRKHGCTLGTVDCDGNPYLLVRNWLEEGVNIMFPLEVAAGVDPFAWRREFGRELRLRGGIDKMAVAQGRAAIDRELERIKPLLDQGGFVPHLDHLVPPDISLDNYKYYLERKWKLIGKTGP